MSDQELDHDNGSSSFADSDSNDDTERNDDAKWRWHLEAAQFADQHGIPTFVEC